MKFHFISSNSKDAQNAKEEYINTYSQTDPEFADIIVPIGGDGILLKSLHDFNELNKPFFGINYGSVGFLMNSSSNKSLRELIENSKSTDLKPLKMKAMDEDDKVYDSIAYNEVSLMRQTHQAAKISININESRLI